MSLAELLNAAQLGRPSWKLWLPITSALRKHLGKWSEKRFGFFEETMDSVLKWRAN